LTVSAASDDTRCAEAGCCGELSAAEGGQSGVEFGDHRLNPIQLTVRAAAFRLLLDKGQPVAVTSVAEAAGVDVATTIAVLEGFAQTGNVSIAGDQVIGIAGLSVEPTRHRVELAAGRRLTWCALDAVGIVGAIGDGVIHSETADRAVELRVADGKLESTDLAMFVAEGYGLTSAVDQWCPLSQLLSQPRVRQCLGGSDRYARPIDPRDDNLVRADRTLAVGPQPPQPE
jgi:hypothetical protein